MNPNGSDRKRSLCVIGDPVAHSKSPLLHNTMCAILGFPFEYGYQTVKKDGLEHFLAQAAAQGYAGFNATMPFKELLLPYLDGLDPLAEKLGAVNTVCIRDGKLYGYNTDCPGYIAALRARGFEPAGKRTVVLGGGGAAKAVAVGLCEAGAAVTVVNRTLARAQAVADLCPGAAALPWTALDLRSTCVSPASDPRSTGVSPASDPPLELGNVQLLVNATPLGMEGQGQFQDLDFLQMLPASALVSDLIYHPAPTLLLTRAAELGLETMDGFPLLIHQAILALEHFSGRSIPVEAVLPALEQAVKS